MDNASYVALSRQMTLRREIDVIANNVANADTVGFKVESLMVAVEPRRPARTADAPSPVKFVLDNGVARDFGQGALRKTENPLDLALEGDGFFTVGAEQGEQYTRDGRFTIDAQSRLVTQTGEPVLAEGGGEIVFTPEGGAPSIAPDGTVGQGAVKLGKIGVVRFADLSKLQKQGEGRFTAEPEAELMPAPDVRVRQGMLEGSNVQPILEITNLIEVSRAYERVTRMIDQTQDLSRRSIERLGRVQ
jgi:flagellar basal-body rod protein FlgF